MSSTLKTTVYRCALALPLAIPAHAEEREMPAQCLETDQIVSYRIDSDETVRFSLKNGRDIIMWLKPHCPQLHFHGYITYTPVNGQLCAGTDEIKTRAGLPCRISHLTFPDSLDMNADTAAQGK